MPDDTTCTLPASAIRTRGKRWWVRQMSDADLAIYPTRCRALAACFEGRYDAHYASVIGTARAEIARRAAARKEAA